MSKLIPITIHKQPQLNHHFIPLNEVRNLWLTRYSSNPKDFGPWDFFMLAGELAHQAGMKKPKIRGYHKI
jgi:hypothetical protein